MRGTGLLVLERVGGVGVSSVGIEAFITDRGVSILCLKDVFVLLDLSFFGHHGLR